MRGGRLRVFRNRISKSDFKIKIPACAHFLVDSGMGVVISLLGGGGGGRGCRNEKESWE